MRPECEKYSGRMRTICEGTADLPLHKINAYRGRWGLPALDGSEVPSPSPIVSAKQPVPRDKRPPARLTKPQQRSINKKPDGKHHHKCGGCGGGKRAQKKPKLNGYGPGSQLLKLWADMPHCDACEQLAAQMDAWGKAGCTQRFDEIVADILPRAKTWMTENKPWVHKILSITSTENVALRLGISLKVRKAIELAEGT